MEETERERLYQDLPNVSKSAIKTYKYFCSFLWWKNDIVKEKEEEENALGIRTDVGTDAHLIFAGFWKKFDVEYLYKNININPVADLNTNPVTQYFYSICMELTPSYDREVTVLKRIFWKFSRLHSARFLYLYNLFNGNKNKVYEYFVPKEVEQFYVVPKYGIYGTIDVVFKDIDESLIETLYIPDMKTGNVPASVLRGPTNLSDETSVKLPTKFMFETHFYGLLWLLAHGWDLHCKEINSIGGDIIMQGFILNNIWIDDTGQWHDFGLGETKEEQKEIDDNKKRYLTKIKPVVRRFNYQTQEWETTQDLSPIVGIIFLTGDPNVEHPVVVKKKFGATSLKTAVTRVNEIKVVYKNRFNTKYYLIREMQTRPAYDQYKCPNCSRNQKCLKEIEENFKRTGNMDEL